MYICKNCGKEISETSVFCRFCGTPLEAKQNAPVSIEESQKAFEALSLKLKQTCDEMVTEFVSKLNGSEVQLTQLQKTAETKDTEISRLKELLDAKEKSLEDSQKQLQKVKAELAEAKAQVKDLTDKISAQSILSANTEVEGEAMSQDDAKTVSIRSARSQDATQQLPTVSSSDSVCPRCGEPLEDGAVFCANCGNKVIKPQSASADVKICPTCGSQIDGDTVFCTNCGTKIR